MNMRERGRGGGGVAGKLRAQKQHEPHVPQH